MVMIRKDTHTQIFNIKQACKESEAAVLWKYDQLPANVWGLTGLPDPSIVLFDYDNDIIYFSRVRITQRLFESASVRYITTI
jgi:hypothetical protein